MTEPLKFRETALSVLSDIASEFVLRAREGGGSELSDHDAQRLFNATMAAIDLGATHQEVAHALRAGFDEGDLL